MLSTCKLFFVFSSLLLSNRALVSIYLLFPHFHSSSFNSLVLSILDKRYIRYYVCEAIYIYTIERERERLKQDFHRAYCCLLCYLQVEDECGEIPMVIVQNKIDLVDQAVVDA